MRIQVFAMAATAAMAGAAMGRDFVSGNLVVSVIGDGSAALSNAAAPTFLAEFSSGGSFIRSLALPTAASGSNHRFSNSGSATSEGQLSRSADGRYLVLGGYDAPVGLASVASTAGSANPRVIARIDMLDQIDTSTALTGAYSGNNIRGVCSLDGSSFWTAGTGAAAAGGVQYATLGAAASTQITTSPLNVRVVNTFGGNLFLSSSSSPYFSVAQVGTGMPTSAATATTLNGLPTASGPSEYDFLFADANTLYITDDRTNGNGGILKFAMSGGSWALQYTLAASATTGLRSITGGVDAGSGLNLLYGITTDNKLVSVLDSGAGAAFTTLATAAANTVFRGVEFAPVPAPGSLALLALSGLIAGRRRRGGR